MTTYHCVDGPLAGQLVTQRRLPHAGRPLTVAVDVGHAVLEVDYLVQGDGSDPSCRDLRVVAVRDAPRPRGLRRILGRP